MPIYEYRCASCGADFEKIVKMKAPAPPCPECSSEEVVKRVSAAGFVLKGGGWYKDHYGLKQGSDSASTSVPAPSSTASSASSSSDGGSSE